MKILKDQGHDPTGLHKAIGEAEVRNLSSEKNGNATVRDCRYSSRGRASTLNLIRYL
jgi:hypothetical protein